MRRLDRHEPVDRQARVIAHVPHDLLHLGAVDLLGDAEPLGGHGTYDQTVEQLVAVASEVKVTAHGARDGLGRLLAKQTTQRHVGALDAELDEDQDLREGHGVRDAVAQRPRPSRPHTRYQRMHLLGIRPPRNCELWNRLPCVFWLQVVC
jgi:hypothetical protein